MASRRLKSPSKVLALSDKDGKLPTKPGIDRTRFLKGILTVIQCLKSGSSIPIEFYRNSTGPDYMLQNFGWHHLHVGYGIDDSVLLIVEQTAKATILIALTDHTIFAERPAGRSLKMLGDKLARARNDARTMEGRYPNMRNLMALVLD